MIATRRNSRLLVVVALIAGSLALAATIAAPAAQSAAYKKCSLSQREQFPTGAKPKPTYNLTLKQRRTSCATAKKVMKAFHSCRSAAAFRCTKKVLKKWSCTGRKTSGTAVLFYGSFTCKWGPRRVLSTYQQNT